MEFLYGIFGVGTAASFIVLVFGAILAATVYFGTKLAFVPAINKFRGEPCTQQQIYALYAAGALLGFFVYILYVVLAVGAFLYCAFAKSGATASNPGVKSEEKKLEGE